MSDVSLPDAQRIVITGVGLTAPGGANTLAAFREQVLAGRSGISTIDLRYMDTYPAGICAFPETKYRKKRKISGEPGQAVLGSTALARPWLMLA